MKQSQAIQKYKDSNKTAPKKRENVPLVDPVAPKSAGKLTEAEKKKLLEASDKKKARVLAKASQVEPSVVSPSKNLQKSSYDKKNQKATGQVATAILEASEAEQLIQDEEELQVEIEKELLEPEPISQALVKEEFTPVNSSREKLILEYAPLIKYVAQKIASRLPANIELDDLISSGVIGLMDAIDKYDSSRDNKFKTYAEFRVRGAILDELRAQDWVPRSVREKAKQLERCYFKLEQEKGRQATDEEVCAEMGISQEEFFEMLNQVRSVSLLSFDDVSSFSKADKKQLHTGSDTGHRGSNPLNEINSAAVKKLISEAIRDLPERQRLVLSLYYYEDLNLKEIGNVLDVTESRVSQLHTQAILKLKAKLKGHWDEFVGLMG